MQRKIDTILFDLDDTLILEAKTARECITEIVDLTGLIPDTSGFFKTMHQQAREIWYKLPTIEYCLKIGISSLEALWADFTGDTPELRILRELAEEYRFNTWNRTLARYNINDPETAKRLSSGYKVLRNSRHILFPETNDALNEFKGKYKLGIITNGTPDLQWKKINGGNLKHFFDYITISGEHGFAKPDRRIFEIALKELSSDYSETVMVGNNLTTDIRGAQNLGILTIWINRDEVSSTDVIEPDFTIRDLSEAGKIITR
ncbi:MAG: HAD family hydrolase [Bacteroidales bacterium]|nr:HAD family hydrolase [Bacteroidales bacterium]